jgi:copper chaperone CopZ
MAAFVGAREDATVVVDLANQGMSCASCVARVENALARVPGVVAMAFSSVSAVTNALLLRRRRPALAEVKHGC